MGTPGLKSGSAQGRCCLATSPTMPSTRLPLISTQRETPPRKCNASHCFSPLHSLLATIRESSITPPFFHENVSILPLWCSALEPQWNSRNRKKSLCWVLSPSPSLSRMVFLDIFLVAAHTAALDFNHAEVTRNSHDSCEFSSHTSFAKASIKPIRPSNFKLAKL